MEAKAAVLNSKQGQLFPGVNQMRSSERQRKMSPSVPDERIFSDLHMSTVSIRTCLHVSHVIPHSITVSLIPNLDSFGSACVSAYALCLFVDTVLS